MYYYKATLEKVVDGDTIDVVIDLGFGIKKKTRLRLNGIDTPEIRTKNIDEKIAGLEAKQKLIELMEGSNDECDVRTIKTGKYGRYLADVYIKDQNNFDLHVNQYLLENGYATAYKD